MSDERYDQFIAEFGRRLAQAPAPRRRAPVTLAASIVAVARSSRCSPCSSRARRSTRSPRPAPRWRRAESSSTTVITERIATFETRTERWYAADPLRWRLTVTSRFPRGHSRRVELSYAGLRAFFYLPSAGTLTIVRGARETDPLPATPGLLGGDPVAELRKRLASGELRDAGDAVWEGKEVRRLVGVQRVGKARRTLTYYVDRDSFAPVGGEMQVDPPRGRTLRSDFRFEVYERLPLNDTTARLLTIAPKPGTKVHRVTLGRR